LKQGELQRVAGISFIGFDLVQKSNDALEGRFVSAGAFAVSAHAAFGAHSPAADVSSRHL
jgi:hypothetical protein